MNTRQTKIRPRVRVAEPAPQPDASPHVAEPPGQLAMADASMPPLPLLARLPEVSLPPNHTKLSLNLDWLKRLDWQQVRRIKLDPNWVAGGVLSLVLLLLLVITFNRTSKPAAEPISANEAPAWNTAGKTPPSSTSPGSGTGASASASAAMPISPLGNEAGAYLTGDTSSNPTHSNENPPYSGDPAVRRLAAETPQVGPSSLQGVHYPRTPHPEISTYQTSGVAAIQTPGQPPYGNEIRTAQREVIAPTYQSPMQAGPQQAGQAHLEGIITRP